MRKRKKESDGRKKRERELIRRRRRTRLDNSALFDGRGTGNGVKESELASSKIRSSLFSAFGKINYKSEM